MVKENLFDVDVFDRKFVEYASESDTYEEAYSKVEQDHRALYGRNKYSNYNSFRNAYTVRLKSRNKAG